MLMKIRIPPQLSLEHCPTSPFYDKIIMFQPKFIIVHPKIMIFQSKIMISQTSAIVYVLMTHFQYIFNTFSMKNTHHQAVLDRQRVNVLKVERSFLVQNS